MYLPRAAATPWSQVVHIDEYTAVTIMSEASVESGFFSDTLHAAITKNVESASGARSLRIYLVM